MNCYQCGRKVPVHGQTTRDWDTARMVWKERYPHPRAGLPNVSTAMNSIDPHGYFCTMRCAARYAIRAVRRGGQSNAT